MLKQRIMGAMLGLPALLVLITANWYFRTQFGDHNDLPLLGIVMLIVCVGGWEVAHIVRQRGCEISPWNGVYAAMILPCIVHAAQLSSVGVTRVPTDGVGLLIDSLGATTGVMLLFLGVWSDVEHHGRPALRANLQVIGAGIYLGATMSTLLLLGRSPLHETATIFIFLSVFGLDTIAYFGGTHFGGAKLTPRISPNKTVSGAVCGLLGAIIIALGYYWIAYWVKDAIPGGSDYWNGLSVQLAWWHMLLMGMGIGIFGQVGDLIESAFKRWGGVKDSGTAILGHGGFLDRFDSLFLAAPICYALGFLFLNLSR